MQTDATAGWEPDWSQAPEGWDWLAQDEDGRWYWYRTEPIVGVGGGGQRRPVGGAGAVADALATARGILVEGIQRHAIAADKASFGHLGRWFRGEAGECEAEPEYADSELVADLDVHAEILSWLSGQGVNRRPRTFIPAACEKNHGIAGMGRGPRSSAAQLTPRARASENVRTQLSKREASMASRIPRISSW